MLSMLQILANNYQDVYRGEVFIEFIEFKANVI